MSLTETRRKIDLLDSDLLKLLNRRMELALVARRFKEEIEDGRREEEVLNRARQNASGLIHPEFIERIFVEMIRESKNVQRKDFRLIAFQGEHGAYGEVASKEWNSRLVPLPCPEFADVFEGVHSELYDYGIVPVENTLGGSVAQVNQLLIHTELHVVGAVGMPIHLCLLALRGTNHREIRSVYSHPQALSQCRRFLQRNNLEAVPYYDTAGAAKMLAEERPKGAAAIADRSCAGLYGLEVMKENVEDLGSNLTRFLVLSKDPNEEEGNKCSVTFSTQHKAGTLFRVLEVFAGKNINLTRIESIPGDPGTYVFFLDFEGSDREPCVREAIEEAKGVTTSLKLMGCYRERKIR
jgi:prephenate dehydratase/chorismate mutase